MKPTIAIAVALLMVHAGIPQYVSAQTPASDGFATELANVLRRLQQNPWQGWNAGTVVVIRYVGDSAKRPDLVYEVLATDRAFARTEDAKGSTFRQEFQVKDQQGLDSALIGTSEVTRGTIEIDGVTLVTRNAESRMHEFPGGWNVVSEWSLANHPAILVRKDRNGFGWRVTSARVMKTIAGREYSCVEITKTLRVYADGPIDVITTQYLSPDVPGHLVEQRDEFFRLVNGEPEPRPHEVTHQRVVEVRAPR
jgi:hypothetical protein